MTAFLYLIQPDGTRVEQWELDVRPAVVGRGETADVFVDDDAMSRGHFLIVGQDNDFFLVDLESSNGTWVGGAPVSAHKLASNELIHAGKSTFYFTTTPLPPAVAPAVAPLTQPIEPEPRQTPAQRG